jgi:hypothetical protein
VVHLRRGLVVPGTPRLAAVDCDDGPLVADENNGFRIVGIDPEILVVVATGSAAEAGPGLAAVSRFPGDGAGDDDGVRVFRIESRNREISAADSARGPRVRGGLRPGLAGIIRAVECEAVWLESD